MSDRAIKIAAAHALAVALVALLVATQCSGGRSEGPELSAAAERGREVYAQHCSACHNGRDPFAQGIQGPPIARSSLELLEARVMRGEYPRGYTPKQATKLMVALPFLKERIGDLQAFLAEVPR